MPVVGSQALLLERFLEREGLPRKPGALLAGLGAKLQRASELPAITPCRDARPTGVPDLDRVLAGGLPRGGIVELTGKRSSGRYSIGLAALAGTTSAGEAAALVDLGDHLDPQAAQAAGVDLTRVLWVRPTRVKEALASAETLLATGFPLVVADLGIQPRGTRFLPDAVWVRLARSAHAHGSSLLLLTPWRLSGIAADVVASTRTARPVWEGEGAGAPRLLSGVATHVTLEKLGRETPGFGRSLLLRAADGVGSVDSTRAAAEGRPYGTRMEDGVAAGSTRAAAEGRPYGTRSVEDGVAAGSTRAAAEGRPYGTRSMERGVAVDSMRAAAEGRPDRTGSARRVVGAGN